MSGNHNSGRNSDLIKQEACYQLFALGRSVRQVAKETGINRRTVARFKESWNEQESVTPATDQPHDDGNDIKHQVREKLKLALLDPTIRPDTWKAVQDGLKYLEKGDAPPIPAKCSSCSHDEGLGEKELD